MKMEDDTAVINEFPREAEIKQMPKATKNQRRQNRHDVENDKLVACRNLLRPGWREADEEAKHNTVPGAKDKGLGGSWPELSARATRAHQAYKSRKERNKHTLVLRHDYVRVEVSDAERRADFGRPLARVQVVNILAVWAKIDAETAPSPAAEEPM